MFCEKCGARIRKGDRFCMGCGAKIESRNETETSIVTCRNCSTRFDPAFEVCPNCGTVAETAENDAVIKTSDGYLSGDGNFGGSKIEKPIKMRSSSTFGAKKKFPKKVFLFGGIGVVAVAVILVALSLFFRIEKLYNVENVLYLKDEEIFLADLNSDDKAWQLTTGLVDVEEYTYKDLLAAGQMYAELTSCVSEDGKYVFFPDKFSNVDKGFNIYYREISNQDADAVKIDSGIKFYVVNSSATVVTYLKGEENNLYQYGMSDDSKDKIASGVTNFEVSADGKKIYYLNSESGLYLKSSGEDKEKIASDVSGLVYVSEDFSTVYYVKDESLYKKVVGKEKVKIASDVTYVIKVYDSGELYYAKEVIEEFAYADLIVDDLKDADAAITRPTYPVYPTKPDSPPSWWRFDGTSEEYDELCEEYDRDLDAWQEECDRLDTEYRDAYEKYSLKLNRDYYREQIETETLKRTVYTLCFYDGTKETVVSENTDGGAYYDYTYLGDDDYICADDTPVIIYRKYDWSDFEKLKFSELLEDVSSFETSIGRALSSSVERYIAVKGTPTLVDDEEGTRYFIVNSSGTLVYYLDNVSETENCGDLYGISVKNGVVGKPELYDSDVSQFYFGFVGDSDLKYFKDFDYVQGDLYINKQIIDYDVVCSSMEIGSGINEIYYYTDWDSNKSYGTLKFYNGKKSTKIADDVSMFSLDSDGRVLYLCDYSLTYYKGALYVWENGESRKIDDDVVYAYSAKPSENRKYVTYS